MKDYIYWFIILSLTVVLMLTIQQCTDNKNQRDRTTETLADTLIYFTNTVGAQTASIATMKADKEMLNSLILSKDIELAKLSKEFSKLSNLTKYKTITKFDTISIIYTDSIAYNFERRGVINKPWYSFSYYSNQNTLKIGNLSVPNTATIITGTKRKWLLGKEVLTTDIINSNPYITVTNIKAAEIIVNVPRYKKWYVWLLTGVAGGTLLVN